MGLVTEGSFGSALRTMENYPRLNADSETTGLRVWQGDRPCGVSLCSPDLKFKYYFPLRHGEGPNLPEYQRQMLYEYMRQAKRYLTGWNFKFDYNMFYADGGRPNERFEDVMLAAHLCNENEYNYKLKSWADKYIDPNSSKAELALIHLLADNGLDKGEMWKLPASAVSEYAIEDVVLTEKARRICKKGLKDWGLWGMWKEVNFYAFVTARMEQRGLQLDVGRLMEYQREATKMIGRAERKLHKLAGYPINPASSKQLSAWLNLPSTAKEVIEPIYEANPKRRDIKALLDFRSWSRANSGYYDAYLARMDSDEVLHPNIKLHGTVAGRPSAEDPNLQAVPRYSPIYRVKDVFVSRPGYSLISGDYAQAEVRMGAHFTRDKALEKLLLSGGDMHTAVSLALGIPRDAAKRINFGIFYGLGAKGLADKLKIPLWMAKDYLEQFHWKFQQIKVYYRQCEGLAKEEGYIRLWTGRARRYNSQWAEPRKAMSNTIQGAVAEIMRHALCRMDTAFQTDLPDTRILLQVHDQIITETPTRQVKKTLRLMDTIMRDFQFRIPLKVDFKTGDRWGTLTDWEKN